MLLFFIIVVALFIVIVSDAAKQVLAILGCPLSGVGMKGESGRDIEGLCFAAAGIDIEQEDILTLQV